jgi:hypothetical protein
MPPTVRFKLAVVFGICVLAACTASCGSKRHEAVSPLYPDYYGVAITQQPSLDGEFPARRVTDVTLTFADGRRILVPSSARFLPTWNTEGCRTERPSRVDGSCNYPCQLQVGLASRDRAQWVRLLTSSRGCGRVGPPKTTGPIESVDSHWLVTQDGTAIPIRPSGKVEFRCMFPRHSTTPTTAILTATRVPDELPNGVEVEIMLDDEARVQNVTCQFGA